MGGKGSLSLTYRCIANAFSCNGQCKKIHRWFIIGDWDEYRDEWFNFNFRILWVWTESSEIENKFHVTKYHRTTFSFEFPLIASICIRTWFAWFQYLWAHKLWCWNCEWRSWLASLDCVCVTRWIFSSRMDPNSECSDREFLITCKL